MHVLHLTTFELVEIIFQAEADKNLDMGAIKWQNCDMTLNYF
jgi:hypothetical protein